MSFRRMTLALMLLSGLMTSQAQAAKGAGDDPIEVHMRRGADRIRLHGVLKEGVDCCTYKFVARKGQHLQVSVDGAAARLVLTYPDGDGEGPGLPDHLELPDNGTYLLDVHPNLMADGAYGRFTLTIAITP